MATINLGRVKGDKGDAASISLGTVSTLSAGSSATATNTGTAGAAIFNFAIPRGDKGETGNTGPANSLTIAGVTTGAAGSSASVSISGTSPSQTLTFAIPKGDQGIQGIQGDTGLTGPQGVIGLTGETGPQGIQGVTGATGATGSTGATGPAGYPAIILFETVSDTTKTITPAAAGKKFRFTNAAGCAITIQPDASGAWTEGQIVYFRRVTGAGALTFNNTGITINGNAISGVLAGEEFALHQVAANTFDFI